MFKSDFVLYAISFCIFPCNPNRIGIVVDCKDRRITHLRGGNRQNSRARADIQKALLTLTIPQPDNLIEAKRSRRVLAGAETKPRIQHDNFLIFARLSLAPTWLDEQSTTDVHRFEMPLPRFLPIRIKLADSDPTRWRRQALRTGRGVDRDGSAASPHIDVNRWDLLERLFKPIRRGVLVLFRRDDRNLPELFI